MNIQIHSYGSEHSVSDITNLLHRAYQRLADLGLRYTATWQDDKTTLARILQGQTYLAFAGTRLVGTITFANQTATRGCAWYDRPSVASFHQFAVDPAMQGQGIGRMLLSKVESEALALGAEEIALDTAEWAYHLIQMYLAAGYRFVDEAQWETTNYRSVILSKNLHTAKPTGGDIGEFLRDKPEVTTLAKIAELEQKLAKTPPGTESGIILSQLGDLYRVQRHAKKALACLERASVSIVQNNQQNLLFVNRLRTAIAYQYANQPEVSEHIFKQLLRDSLSAIEPKPPLDFVHQHYGKLLVEQRKYLEALHHLNQAKDLRIKNQDPSFLRHSTQEAIQGVMNLIKADDKNNY